MFSLVTLALLALVPALIYAFMMWNYNYWSKRGVKGPKSQFLVGSFPNLFSQKQHFADDMADIYRKFKNTQNYVGVYQVRAPQLLILNPSLVHEVLVTAFKHFQDNDLSKFFDAKKDSLVANNPFVQRGEKWKEQRALVTPGLTGIRIRNAYETMQKVSRKLCDYIEKESKLSPPGGLDAKNIAVRFTAENITDSVLGIQGGSFTDNPIPIAKHADVFGQSSMFLIFNIIAGIIPDINKIYKPKIVSKEADSFFIDLLKKAFSLRMAEKVDRQDFLNYLLSMKEKKHLNDSEMMSHSMTFVLDGLDTTAIAISGVLLMLGRNQNAQEKLRQEILNNLDDVDGELSFEKLNELPYLDACIHEAIRIFPPAPWSSKIVTQPYEFTNKNGDKVILNVNETVVIPMYAIHHDPDYYPNPEEFQPERFLPENGGVKKYREMGVYLGFSDGPRMCLGMRFALVQMKAAIAAIVRNFVVKVNPKTKPGFRLDPKSLIGRKDGGIWLDFERINS